MRTKILLVLFTLFLLVSFAQAEITIEENDLNIPVNYGNLIDDENLDLFTGHQITLTNNGDIAEILTLEIIDLNSNYDDFVLSQTSLTLNPNESKTVSLSGKTPVSTDQGKQEGVAKLKVTSAALDQNFNLNTEVESMIKINKMYVHLDGSQEESVNGDGENVEALPGDKVEFRFRLENLFHEDYDHGDIEGTITVVMDDSDFGDDIDEEEDFQLDADERITDDDDEIVISFNIPEDADDSNYDFIITLEAEDENEAKYEIDWEFTIKVERERDDLRFEKLTISPEQIDCTRNIQVSTEVMNYGKDKQKYALLTITNFELGIDEKHDFDIKSGSSSDNKEIFQFSKEIDEKIKAGTYVLEGFLYYDYNEFSHSIKTDLIVKDCVIEEEEEETEEGTTTVITSTLDLENKGPTTTTTSDTTDTNSQLSSGAIVDTVEDSYNQEDIIIAALIVIIVLMLAMIIIFAIVLLK
jgi:hypothetical protein